MSKPVLTLLLPTIGRLDFLEDVKHSVRSQTYGDFEAIVLDNASPPPAQRALGEWAASDRRMTIVRSDARLPMFRNFNRGIAMARGEYIAFFHDDDVYRPRFLERAVQALSQHPTAAFFGGNYDWIDQAGAVRESRRWVSRSHLVAGHDYIEMLLHRGRNMIVMPGIVFRRKWIERGLDETLSMHFGDFTFLMRLAEIADVFLSAECDLALRRHSEQASQAIPLSGMIPRRTQAMQEYCDEYLSRHPHDTAFVARARKRIDWVHLAGLCWAWTNAGTDGEAEACAAALCSGRVSVVGRALRVIGRAGLRETLVSKRVRRVLRAVADRSSM